MANTMSDTMADDTDPEQLEGVGSNMLAYFPYDEPRDSQADGMATIYQNAQENGYTMMEGACGTGKTLTALVPYIDQVRTAGSGFDRILVGTSVKQQMEAFQDEVARINEGLDEGIEPVSAITLVGKADIDPYVHMGTVDEEDVYDESERLRQNTLELLQTEEDGAGYTTKELCEHAREAGRPAKNDPDLPDYPYPKHPPSIVEDDPLKPPDERRELEYDPFYASYLELKRESDAEDGVDAHRLPVDPRSSGLIRPDALRDHAAGAGVCPHATMKASLEHVDLIIANYYHIFEPQTVERMTGEFIDEKTLLVLDEAHNLVPRVRDLLGVKTALSTIERAIDEVREMEEYLTLDIPLVQAAREQSFDQLRSNPMYDEEEVDRVEDLMLLADTNADRFDRDDIDLDVELNMVTNQRELLEAASYVQDSAPNMNIKPEFVAEWREFLEGLVGAVKRRLDNEYGSLNQHHTGSEGEVCIPLREADSPQKDDITEWVLFSDNGIELMEASERLGEATHALREAITMEVRDADETVRTSAEWAGHVLTAWAERDNTQYFRQVKLEERNRRKDADEVEHEWEREYTAHLHIDNCIPSKEIADRLDQFGAGVLMSATLEPLDVYREVSGLDYIADERPLAERTYGLHFPEENRSTIAVDAEPFKYDVKKHAWDRGSPSLDNEHLQTYYDSIKEVVNTTPGNVLVVMPTYSEAEWAGRLLRKEHGLNASNILVDKSSSNWETNQMKEQFFRSDNAVLVTGAHGTLTEGVDYDGDRLHGVVVCGVPIENTQAPYKTAIRTAYQDEYGDDGYDYAFVVPAVRKTRQAIGRVIRSDEDVGVRAFVDRRYATDSVWDSVQEYLSPEERDELKSVDPDSLDMWLDAFWSKRT